MSWNIDKGYQVHKIIQALKEQSPDIVLLQELDIGCDRTRSDNIPDMIAEALSMNCVFVPEFQEVCIIHLYIFYF